MSARRRIRRAAVAGLTLVGITAGVFFGLQHALRLTPDFYAEAVAIPSVDQQQAGREFERNVLALHNDLQQSGRWKRVFSEAQINGWLAVDLPEKFPELLPPTIVQPRIDLVSNRLQIAFQYQGDRLATIVSLSLEVSMAEEPNSIAIRVLKAQAGAVPIPLKDFLDQISDSARRANIRLHWAQQDGDPVALITLPTQHDADNLEPFVIEMIEIKPGELAISGRSTGVGEDE